MGNHQKIDKNPNFQSYSCIKKLDNNFDLSYDILKKEIKKSIKSIEKHKKNKNFGYNKNIEKEYNLLLDAIDKDYKHFDNLVRGVNHLCRYKDIKTYKYNSLEINTEKKFINASPINIINDKYVIATQGPISNTIEDFWTMIDQYDCHIIVMLCSLKEENKEKCSCYWDINNNMEKYKINEIKEEEKKFDKSFVIIRKISLFNKIQKVEKTITQLHFSQWPDYDVVNVNEIFDVFQFMIEEIDKLKDNTPGVVHCSAGVGRTGSFISIYFLYKEIMAQIKDNNLDKINFSVFNMVRKLKEMRLYMVQNYQQYKFIYDFVNLLLIKYNK